MGLTLHGPNGTRVSFALYTPYGHHMGQVDFVWAISGPRVMNPTLIPYNPSGAHTMPRSWYQMGPRWVMWEQYGIDVTWPKWDPCQFCNVHPIRAPYGTSGFGMGYIWAMRHESHINPIWGPHDAQIMIPNGPQMGYVGTIWDWRYMAQIGPIWANHLRP